MSAAAIERGNAITSWNRWGHKRPRAWLVKYGGLYVPEWHVIRDFQREAKEATKKDRLRTYTTNDPRMIHAP